MTLVDWSKLRFLPGGENMGQESAAYYANVASSALIEVIGFDPTRADTTITVPGTRRPILRLPRYPLIAVTSLTLIPPGDYPEEILDLDDERVTWHPSGELYRPYGWWDIDYQIRAEITYGYECVPAWVEEIGLRAALSAYGNPSGGVKQETIGAYSVTYSDDTPPGVTIPEHDRMRLRQYFKQRTGTAHLAGLR